MNFSTVELTAEQRAFVSELTTFLDRELTPELYERQRLSTDHFDEDFHRAMGRRGWIMPQWTTSEGGAGLDPVCVRLLDLELERREAPRAVIPMLNLIWPAVAQHAQADLAAELKPGVADGSVRMCLGYSEPDGGSDIAAAKVRAVRDGDEWVIDGAKVFTSNAHNCQYSFLITRTNPSAPKHRGLTMFLVPLDLPGIDIQPLQMLANTRTNIVYFGETRVSDRYRIGDVDQGWSVLHGPLDAEHDVILGPTGLEDISIAARYLRYLTRALEATIEWSRTAPSVSGAHAIDDPALLARLGHVALEIEAGLCTPGALGRVKCADVAIDCAQELIGLIGPEATLMEGADGALSGGVVEHAHQVAQATSIYGGTNEVFRAIIAEQLGLPRPDYPGRKVFLASDS